MIIAIFSVLGAACVVVSYACEGAASGTLTLIGLTAGLLLGNQLGAGRAADTTNRESRMARMKLPQGFFIYVIAIVQAGIAALLIWVINDQKDYETCMARWQQAATISTNARATANATVQAKLDDVMLSIPTGDREAFRKALAAYLDYRKQQEQQRAKTPIPPLPETVCGEVR